MTKIVIHREREVMNMLRNYKIIVDGKVIEELANGETREISVEKGIHKIKAKIDWCSSNTMKISSEDGDELNIHVSSSTLSNWITIALLTSLSITEFMYSTFSAGYNQFVLIPCSLFLIYPLWLLRDKYLIIKACPF